MRRFVLATLLALVVTTAEADIIGNAIIQDDGSHDLRSVDAQRLPSSLQATRRMPEIYTWARTGTYGPRAMMRTSEAPQRGLHAVPLSQGFEKPSYTVDCLLQLVQSSKNNQCLAFLGEFLADHGIEAT